MADVGRVTSKVQIPIGNFTFSETQDQENVEFYVVLASHAADLEAPKL